MDYGVLPKFHSDKSGASSVYEREKQAAFERELQAAQEDVRRRMLERQRLTEAQRQLRQPGQ
eukprot:791807-Prymnesium_polylepis.1